MKTKSKSNRLTAYKQRLLNLFNYKLKFLQENDFTIISNNCVAGYMYQDIEAKYNSPTIGLQFPQEDFVKFCDSFAHYLEQPIVLDPNPNQEEFKKVGGKEIDFPVGRLGDLTIFFQHYKTIDDAIAKWNDRKKRIVSDKLLFVFMAYDSTPDQILHDFNALKIPNSIILTNSPRPQVPNTFAINNGKEPWHGVIEGTEKKHYQRFGFINWVYKGCK